MRKYAVHIDIAPAPEMKKPTIMTVRDRIYAERRLKRIAARADAARGTCLNLDWFHWFGEWQTLHDALGCVADDCGHG